MHAVCTIVVRNCIAQARVWARSCVEHNPRAQFYALVIDGEEEDRVLEGLGEAVLPRDLPIPASTLDSMQVMYRLRRHHVGRLAPVPRTRRDLGPPAHQPRAARGAVGTDQGDAVPRLSPRSGRRSVRRIGSDRPVVWLVCDTASATTCRVLGGPGRGQTASLRPPRNYAPSAHHRYHRPGRPLPLRAPALQGLRGVRPHPRSEQPQARTGPHHGPGPVSYPHLTLPTIYSV